MEMNLQALAPECCVTHEPFAAGERVASFLARDQRTGEIRRYDVKADASADFQPEGAVVCRWVQQFKPRPAGERSDRNMRLTAEALFLTLADPATEQTEENTRLLQFLALMLERKKVVRLRGRTPDGARDIYEHMKSRQRYEVPAGELTREFFIRVQEQLGVLTGDAG